MKDTHAYASRPLDELYRWFAGEADATSPTWGALCRWIADTPPLLAWLDELPGAKRQPNLFLGALRYHGGPVVGGPGLLAWLDEHAAAVRETILARATQTNEPGRCAVIAPVLASLPQPVALLEVGASAGLCLLPDRYRYAYRRGGAVERVRGTDALPTAPELACDETGERPGTPSALHVVHRAGLDANPLPADDPDDARWLRSLVWPGEDAREARLSAALAVAAADPPPVRRGVLPGDLSAFLAEGVDAAARLGATPVLLHSATLAYLTRPDQASAVATIKASGVRWVSLEGRAVVREVSERVPDDGRPHFVLGLDGDAVARCGPHGGWVDWL